MNENGGLAARRSKWVVIICLLVLIGLLSGVPDPQAPSISNSNQSGNWIYSTDVNKDGTVDLNDLLQSKACIGYRIDGDGRLLDSSGVPVTDPVTIELCQNADATGDGIINLSDSLFVRSCTPLTYPSTERPNCIKKKLVHILTPTDEQSGMFKGDQVVISGICGPDTDALWILANDAPIYMTDGDCSDGTFSGMFAPQLDHNLIEVTGQNLDGDAFIDQLVLTKMRYSRFLEIPPAAGYFSVVTGISGDGEVAVGYGSNYEGVLNAYHWTHDQGTTLLAGPPGGSETFATGISADGAVISTIVSPGNIDPDEADAALWIEGSGSQTLPPLSNVIGTTAVLGLSGDGTHPVGSSISNFEGGQTVSAVRWNSGVIEQLGSLPGSPVAKTQDRAVAASFDGSVIAGTAESSLGVQAFLWSTATGMVGLGDLQPQNSNPSAVQSTARAISSNGLYIVGEAQSPQGTEAFIWSAAEGMVGLGDLPGGDFMSSSRAVSDDGGTVVGVAATETGDTAFIWDKLNGMRELKVVLQQEYGFDLTGWELTSVDGMSFDGKVIVGNAIRAGSFPEGWIAYLYDKTSPPDPSGDPPTSTPTATPTIVVTPIVQEPTSTPLPSPTPEIISSPHPTPVSTPVMQPTAEYTQTPLPTPLDSPGPQATTAVTPSPTDNVPPIKVTPPNDGPELVTAVFKIKRQTTRNIVLAYRIVIMRAGKLRRILIKQPRPECGFATGQVVLTSGANYHLQNGKAIFRGQKRLAFRGGPNPPGQFRLSADCAPKVLLETK